MMKTVTPPSLIIKFNKKIILSSFLKENRSKKRLIVIRMHKLLQAFSRHRYCDITNRHFINNFIYWSGYKFKRATYKVYPNE